MIHFLFALCIGTNFAKVLYIHSNGNDITCEADEKTQILDLIYNTAIQKYIEHLKKEKIYELALNFSFLTASNCVYINDIVNSMFTIANTVLKSYRLNLTSKITKGLYIKALKEMNAHSNFAKIGLSQATCNKSILAEYKDKDSLFAFFVMVFDDIVSEKLKCLNKDTTKRETLVYGNLYTICNFINDYSYINLYDSVCGDADIIFCSLNFLDVYNHNERYKSFQNSILQAIEKDTIIVYELDDSAMIEYMENVGIRGKKSNRTISVIDTNQVQNFEILNRIPFSKTFHQHLQRCSVLMQTKFHLFEKPESAFNCYNLFAEENKDKYSKITIYNNLRNAKNTVSQQFKQLTYKVFGRNE